MCIEDRAFRKVVQISKTDIEHILYFHSDLEADVPFCRLLDF